MDDILSASSVQGMQSAFRVASTPFNLYKSLDNKIHDAAVKKNEEQERVNQQVADAMAIAPSGQGHNPSEMEF